MSSVAYAPDTAQAPKYQYSELALWRHIDERARTTGRASIDREYLRHSTVCRMTIWRWIRNLIRAGRLAVAGWLNRCRAYTVLQHAPKPPQSEMLHVDVTCREVHQNITFSELNIDNIERSQKPLAPPPVESKPKTDLWTAFRADMAERTGQILEDRQIGVICRELKRKQMTLWEFWSGLDAHPIHHARNLGKVLFTIATNRLGWPKPKKETPSERADRHYHSSAPTCPKCLGRMVIKGKLCECVERIKRNA